MSGCVIYAGIRDPNNVHFRILLPVLVLHRCYLGRRTKYNLFSTLHKQSVPCLEDFGTIRSSDEASEIIFS